MKGIRVGGGGEGGEDGGRHRWSKRERVEEKEEGKREVEMGWKRGRGNKSEGKEQKEEEKYIRSCHEALNIQNGGGILGEEDKEEKS